MRKKEEGIKNKEERKWRCNDKNWEIKKVKGRVNSKS